MFAADDTELHAQVPAEVSPSPCQRHPQASLLHVSHLRLQGDGVHRRHRLPERKGEISN